MAGLALRAITLLAHNLFPKYEFALRYLSQQLGCEIQLVSRFTFLHFDKSEEKQ